MESQTAPRRRGPVGIRHILDDIICVLPPENNNPAYMCCHTTFSLLQRTIKYAEESTTREKDCLKLQKLEVAFRKPLSDLRARKGVPLKM